SVLMKVSVVLKKLWSVHKQLVLLLTPLIFLPLLFTLPEEVRTEPGLRVAARLLICKPRRELCAVFFLFFFISGRSSPHVSLNDDGFFFFIWKQISGRSSSSVLTQEGALQADVRSAEEIRSEAEYQLNVWKGFLICIPYSSSIGGTATLTGTAPNLIMIGQLKSYFPDCDIINFGSWFAFAFPLMVIFLFVGWLWIAYLYGGLNTRLCFKRQDHRAQAEARARAMIEEDYRKLGPINFAQGSIAFFFVLFSVLLFTRDPKFVTGWSVFFKKGYVSDAVTGVIIVSVLFFFPSQKPSLRWWLDPKASNTPYVPLLSWKKAQDSVPWNIILLLGGGFAMAKACEESGLASWIGGHLQPLAEVPPAAAVMLITAFLATFTEFASNTATIIIFLPVIAELAIRVSVHPLYFMIPASVACSYAFMLPVSTPPNSIAFASGHLMVKDMVKTGFVMNILGVLSISLAMNTWGVAMFDLNTYPEWALPINKTAPPVHPLNATI
uniref:Solute carrier family 13 member 3 n=1 Tax=Cynoglossus semilaevis TaxID=244447 RepID=A0A3P8X3C3_CYNSE